MDSYSYTIDFWQGIARAGRDLRVELHPATDAWMRGDRFGTITHVGRSSVTVRLDKSGRETRVAAYNIRPNNP